MKVHNHTSHTSILSDILLSPISNWFLKVCCLKTSLPGGAFNRTCFFRWDSASWIILRDSAGMKEKWVSNSWYMTATSKVTVHIESVCCWIRYIEPSEKRQCTKKYGSWVVSLNSFLWKQGRFWLVTSKCCHPLGLFSACHLDLSCVVYGVACLLQISAIHQVADVCRICWGWQGRTRRMRIRANRLLKACCRRQKPMLPGAPQSPVAFGAFQSKKKKLFMCEKNTCHNVIYGIFFFMSVRFCT